MLILGCDPGYSGAIVVLYDGVFQEVFNTSRVKFPSLCQWLQGIEDQYEEKPTVVLELVHAFPGQGVCSVWTFGEANGRLLQALTILNDPIMCRTSPQKWQKFFALKPTSNFNNAYAKKTSHLEHAQKLALAHQPVGQPPTFLNRRNADAYLMGMYAWLK